MDVRSEAVAGAIRDADDLRLRHLLAPRDEDPLLVRVAGGETAAVVDAGVVPVAALGSGDRDGPGRSRAYRRAGRDRDVDALVHPPPAHPKARDNGAVDRPDEPAAPTLNRSGR